MKHLTRRQFVSAAAYGAALASAQVGAQSAGASANDALRVGLIGTGGRYRSYLPELARHKDVTVVAICDVDEARMADAGAAVESTLGAKPRRYADYRKLLEESPIDVAFVATTHHWHVPVALAALEANADVYVEKPASHVFREGRLLVDTAARNNKLVQHGTQMRSSEVTAKAGEILTSGLLGEIKMSKAWNVQRRRHPGPAPDGEAPAGVDYDMWLGPAPKRRFNPNRFHGNWHAYREYGNGDIGNDGAHDLDMARFGLGVTTHPVKITAHASTVDPTLGERDFADNMTVAYQYADGRVLLYEDRLWTPYHMNGFDSGNAFYGTKGYMIFSRRGYIQTYLGENDEQGPGMKGGAGMSEHVDDFLDAVRTRRQPNASAEIAHLSCGLIHLGEIAARVERILKFDPENERILGDDEADAMLTKTYREPYGLPTAS